MLITHYQLISSNLCGSVQILSGAFILPSTSEISSVTWIEVNHTLFYIALHVKPATISEVRSAGHVQWAAKKGPNIKKIAEIRYEPYYILWRYL